MDSWKENISFVLVEPLEAGNIGACARAIKNMGFKNLEIVNPPNMDGYEAKAFAHSALDVLAGAKIRRSLDEAMKDKSLIVGTSRRFGRKRGLTTRMDEAVERIRQVSNSNKVGILFGREDKGLSNEEIDECAFLVHIPSAKEAPSLNISQAVMITAYELFMHSFIQVERIKRVGNNPAAIKDFSTLSFVKIEELEFLFERIDVSVATLGYKETTGKSLIRNLKHMIGRAGLTDWELKLLHGVCSQIERRCGKDK